MTARPGAVHQLDELDIALIRALREHPRAGVLELSRVLRVARGTVQSRIQRLEDSGVVSGYGPDVQLSEAGYPVHAFVSLEIAQGALDEVASALEDIPYVIEAHVTTGSSDVLCKLATASHQELQEVLLRVNRLPSVVRSTSFVALSVLVAPRVLPLLGERVHTKLLRAPAYRAPAVKEQQ